MTPKNTFGESKIWNIAFVLLGIIAMVSVIVSTRFEYSNETPATIEAFKQESSSAKQTEDIISVDKIQVVPKTIIENTAKENDAVKSDQATTNSVNDDKSSSLSQKS